MNTNRKSAIAAGVLLILATLTGPCCYTAHTGSDRCGHPHPDLRPSEPGGRRSVTLDHQRFCRRRHRHRDVSGHEAVEYGLALGSVIFRTLEAAFTCSKS